MHTLICTIRIHCPLFSGGKSLVKIPRPPIIYNRFRLWPIFPRQKPPLLYRFTCINFFHPAAAAGMSLLWRRSHCGGRRRAKKSSRVLINSPGSSRVLVFDMLLRTLTWLCMLDGKSSESVKKVARICMATDWWVIGRVDAIFWSAARNLHLYWLLRV